MKEAVIKAVTSTVLPDVMDWRKRRRLDRWDEMWDGVLHMLPPNLGRQDSEWSLETFLRQHWAPERGAWIYQQTAVAPPDGRPNNYRVRIE